MQPSGLVFPDVENKEVTRGAGRSGTAMMYINPPYLAAPPSLNHLPQPNNHNTTENHIQTCTDPITVIPLKVLVADTTSSLTIK